ncbi:MAG: hypothetical protein ACFFCW_33135 [Candidatus Hodarchaeota archaeon]
MDQNQEIEVTFQNNESPGAPLECTWNGRKFMARDGEKVKWPVDFIQHLHMDCAYPRYDYDIDAATGQLVHKQVGHIRRFSCIPVSIAVGSMPTTPNEFAVDRRVGQLEVEKEQLELEKAELESQNAALQEQILQLSEKVQQSKNSNRSKKSS